MRDGQRRWGGERRGERERERLADTDTEKEIDMQQRQDRQIRQTDIETDETRK